MTDKINYLKNLFESGEGAESFTQKINDFFPGIIYVYDTSSRKLRYINKHLTDILGFSYEDVNESDDALMNLVFKEDLENVKKELDKFNSINDDESLAYGCRLNQKAGSWRYFRTMGTILRRHETGKAASLLFISQDITDQMKNQEEVTAIRELFNETEDLLQFGSWNWDEREQKGEWTKGLYAIFEFDPEEIKQIDSEFYTRHIADEDVDRYIAAIEEAKRNHSPFEIEYVIKTKTGKKKAVSTKGRVILDAEGKVHRLVGITRDVTTMRNFEKERERSIRELNRSNRELEEFAYVASHDLQEPLRKISTFSERIKLKFEDALGKDGNLYLDRILASTENMRSLIDNLLEFSRTTRSSKAYQQCDLNEVIRNVVSNLELLIEETKCKISFDRLPVIEAVTPEISQLFNNLISNAIKFRSQERPSEVTVTVERPTNADKDRHHLRLDINYFKVIVSDNGIGFEAEYADRIFQIFQRLHGKAEYAGSGIGLAICKKIVDNHEGVIYAQSEVGRGSSFIIILPEKQHF